MILHEQKYIEFIERNGVGKNDRVASSPNSYLSYLRSVSKLISEDITPELFRSKNSVATIAKRIKGKRADSTIRNYCSAMQRYFEMVNEFGL